MKIFSKILCITAIIAICIVGCKKDPEFESTKIETTEVSQITGNSAVSGGIITTEGTPTISRRGVCWNTQGEPTLDDNTEDYDGDEKLGSFSVTMHGLNENTTYYIRAFASNKIGVIYGEDVSFTTPHKADLSSSSVKLIDISSSTAKIQVSIADIDTSLSKIKKWGICYSLKENPTTNDEVVYAENNESKDFTCELDSLLPNTKYYIRAFATNVAGTSYGEQITFKTSAVAPTVTTSSASNVAATSVTLGGSVTSNGGLLVATRGICWNTSGNPKISDSKKDIGSGTGSFSANITGLQALTTYYVRAYATNSKGTSYGEQITFKTSAGAPTVTTSSASNVAATSVTLGGNVTSDGGATVTERGVCWNTSTNPTISNSKKAIGSGIGSFSASITGLAANTTYYVRAYATNSKETSYGEQIMVKTTQVKIVNGAIQVAFSVSSTKKVYFSMGNLQYQASTKTWRFAEHQYDVIGVANKNISSTYSGWIDLFGWGTSGWNSGAYAYQPYSTSPKNMDYYPGGSYTNNLTGSYANADWGVFNAIQNGGNSAGMWRTLTKDEWDYVLSKRTDASSLMGSATVNGVTGMILLPDNWTTPSSITFKSGENSFSSNTYTTSDWVKMEANGAVFLPAAGNSLGTAVYVVGSYGYYWSSSAYDYDYAFCLYFRDVSASVLYTSRCDGRSVRLVLGL